MHIILADDHTLFREGLATLLRKKFEIEKIYEANDVSGVFQHLDRAVHFSLILLDYAMPGVVGVETIRSIVEMSGRPVVVISGLGDRSLIRELFHCGIAGFIPKTARGELMLGALQLVISGGVYVPDSLLDEADLDLSDRAPLTQKQKDILDRIALGRSNREIASELNISEHTVRVHTTALLKRFGARNRTQLAVLARTRGDLMSS